MKKIQLSVLFLLFIVSSLAQEISQLEIISNKGSALIPVFKRQGTVYFSVKDFADVLGINYYYNPASEKVELKFSNFNLKVTSKNPYLVLTTKGNNIRKIFQLPTSSYFINNQIFIPLLYSKNILEVAYGKKFVYDTAGKLNITDETSDLSIIINNEVEDLRYPSTSGDAIYDLEIEEKANGTLVRVKSKKKINSAHTIFNAGVLSLNLGNVTADVDRINNIIPGGLIKSIYAKNINGHTQINFGVTKNYTNNEVIKLDNSNDVILTIHNKIFNRTNISEKKDKWNFDVIVIDAGHGGKDPGSIGVNGVKEKDVNLGIALKLGKLIEDNMKDVKVVYTRKTDKFVELYKRGKIANESNGKLFISIHCNSLNKKPSNPNGFEVYLLRPGRTQEAIEIAERENSVIEYEENPDRYEKLTDENFILVSMAQSSYMKYSEKFAELLDNNFSRDLNLKSRGVKQAGFYVLVGASMPSVLVESGFLSNRNDASYLSSANGQEKIAQSIFKGIKQFKDHYEKILETEL